jgi:hypothetical protein
MSKVALAVGAAAHRGVGWFSAFIGSQRQAVPVCVLVSYVRYSVQKVNGTVEFNLSRILLLLLQAVLLK